MNKIIIAIVLIVLGGGLYFYMSPKPVQAPEGVVNSETPATSNTVVTDTTATTENNTSVKEFIITGSSFAFSPSNFSVKKGDRVRVVFKNSGGTHDFKIDEFNVATKKISGGTEDTVEFTADKVGSFEYYCSVGSHRAMGMKGTLTVTE